jgi:hypothetical protein
MVMKYCGNGKYNKRLVMIGEAFVELEKYMDACDPNMDLLNMLHLGSLPQTAGWID